MIPEIQERISKLEAAFNQLAAEKAQLERNLNQLREQLCVAPPPEVPIPIMQGCGGVNMSALGKPNGNW